MKGEMKVMKKIFKRSISWIMCVIMCVLMGACGQPEKQQNTQQVEEVTFPLEEKVTFTFMVSGTKSSDFDQKIADNALMQKLEKETNVHIEFMFIGDDSEKLNLLITSGKYGDVLCGGPIINSVEASKYMASDKLQDITDYIIPELMPELCKDIEENPEIKKMITASDGRIYTLPKISGIEGHYLESPIWINKVWLDKLGLGIPTTLDEFTNMLRAFKTKDPNGNGLPDEIPYICSTDSDSMHLEALLGIFGIATKDGDNDAFVQVRDGKVEFIPTTEAYKQGIKYLASLYAEELMWSECFTANVSSLNSKLSSSTPVVGCFTDTVPIHKETRDDYICIYPPKAEGYDPCWYYHPGINGSKNQFFVTDKCENVSVLMAWMDKLYNVDNAVAVEYGMVGEGRVEIDANGKYTILELTSKEADALAKDKPTLHSLMGNPVRSITASDFSDKINLSEEYQILQNNYSIYKDIINKELWPRPYYAAEYSYEVADYVVDINSQVASYRAQWISGRSDIDKDWDAFVKSFEGLGLNEYLEIMQQAYDTYNGS